ncbi:hypothetical protein [Streptomyces anthocyanicus]|uniref:hypothetical protein n=1 Tax=Streptomyces anthocyanicus TaxID=68174 RepID=UPI002F90B6ED|nr:hypothetical protein OH747_41200 [Streptomyces anthocyanicus]
MSTHLLLKDTADLSELDLDIQISETGEGPAFASGGATSPSTYGSPCNLCCW